MKELNFRKLRADEIQVRPTDTKYKGSCLLLLYQDARCAMNILDETVGQFGWQKKYENINDNVYCGIAIMNNEKNEWVWKYDCGAFTAKDNDMQSKADASDATKRAAVCWGIGRELYATPRIKINCPESYYYNEKMNMTFTVKSIEWDGNELVDLVIVDKFGKKVYDFTEKPIEDAKGDAVKNLDNGSILKNFCSSQKCKVETKTLKAFYDYWSKKIENGGFKGVINPSSLWSKWIERESRPKAIPSNSNDMSIQDYEKRTFGGYDESLIY